MERERWTNMDRGERHILVNLADFTAKIIDQGEVTFRTRSVIGMNRPDRRSPEFSDTMEHMIVNPSWHVPRSIITKGDASSSSAILAWSKAFLSVRYNSL